MRSRAFFTAHAIERLIERFPEWARTRAEAIRALKQLSESAVRLRERTRRGDEQWISGRVVFVVKHDPRRGPVCVTIKTHEELELEVRRRGRVTAQCQRRPIVLSCCTVLQFRDHDGSRAQTPQEDSQRPRKRYEPPTYV